MPVREDIKQVVERVTGLWRPDAAPVKRLRRTPQVSALLFKDDGKTPNNQTLPLIVYRKAVAFDRYDPAAVFEVLFEANGWGDAWRDGMYPYNHFHGQTHEVLGIARGWVRALFGGPAKGKAIKLEAGDAVMIPAGVGHKRLGASKDLLIVGAYPERGNYDEPRPTKAAHDTALSTIPAVPLPKKDPIYGAKSEGLKRWRNR